MLANDSFSRHAQGYGFQDGWQMSDLGAEKASRTAKSLRKEIEESGKELAYLQRKCRELGIPVLVVVEGLSAAGKGTIINRMIQPMDPRGFKVSCIASPNRDEQMRPFLWRFWRRTPSADRMAIFDRSWYRNLLDAEIENQLNEAELIKAYSDVRAFERQLKDGGTVILKFFLEISKKNKRLAFLPCRQIPPRPGGFPMPFCRGTSVTTITSRRWKGCSVNPAFG